ncbi:hypothetical protein Naga_100283g5 [Nannochloropsis gaditana]|uniref:Uncharacterized protein n=1 Tax=Nannochloropsis gaditana TaxID=72520 RepID=W7TBB2_9STRA|nr:hypothetical protein Naga_100283g5 [Nannochloropsis gaditana]
MVSATRRHRRYGGYGGGSGGRGKGTGRGGAHAVGQQGVDETLLRKYHQAADLIAPVERDEEKRNVHRVREYWLEHEAIKHLATLQALQIPVATFESHFLQANAHNPKYVRGTLRETVRTFFREFTDEAGVRVLTLKLSERMVYSKPSKNILKRWNLSNGMLYFFYAAVGRSAPPTGDEILEPFYFQKRVDFIRKVCGGGEGAGSDVGLALSLPPALRPAGERGQGEAVGGGEGLTEAGVGTAATAAGGLGGRGERHRAGSHDFFYQQEQLQQAGRSRKRRREGGGAPLPLSELYVPADPVSASVEKAGVKEEAPVEVEDGDEEAVHLLLSFLKERVWAGVEEKAVRDAVSAGVWRLVAEESLEADPSLAYLARPARTFWVPSLAPPAWEEGKEGGVEGGVEGWGWENGCLPVFVRACRRNWAKVEGVWEAWNEDLGNNALEWKELWRDVGAEEGEEGGVEEDLGMDLGLELKAPVAGESGRKEEEDSFLLFPCSLEGAQAETENVSMPSMGVMRDGREDVTEGVTEGGLPEHRGAPVVFAPVPDPNGDFPPLGYGQTRPFPSLVPSTDPSSLSFSSTPTRSVTVAPPPGDVFFSVSVEGEDGKEDGREDRREDGREGAVFQEGALKPWVKQEEMREEREEEATEVVSAGTSAAATVEGGEGGTEEVWEDGEEGRMMMDLGLNMGDATLQAFMAGVGGGMEGGKEGGKGGVGGREGMTGEVNTSGRGMGEGGCGLVDESFYFAYPGPQSEVGSNGEVPPLPVSENLF